MMISPRKANKAWRKAAWLGACTKANTKWMSRWSTGSFEVTINNKLVFSKLQSNTFPHHGDIIAAVKAARDGLMQNVISGENITIKKKTCTVL
ncbi:migration and invasion enhancer 1-like [Leucoraja erinacea]|uniref:migration and invasion enhancer 1-like n=1 Tax=Leucoraja erinaceus TaxID=7782 RepID=UPI002454B48E|nr:migration and invasion enhancer 1-like [Leucoraja erinacea]